MYGIGNCSCEQYNNTIHVCALHVIVYLFVLSNEAKKWPKPATAAYLLSNNSQKKTVSRFCHDYSSEEVSTLDVNSEGGGPNPLS